MPQDKPVDTSSSSKMPPSVAKLEIADSSRERPYVNDLGVRTMQSTGTEKENRPLDLNEGTRKPSSDVAKRNTSEPLQPQPASSTWQPQAQIPPTFAQPFRAAPPIPSQDIVINGSSFGAQSASATIAMGESSVAGQIAAKRSFLVSARAIDVVSD